MAEMLDPRPVKMILVSGIVACAPNVAQNITVDISDSDHLLIGNCIEYQSTGVLFTIEGVVSQRSENPMMIQIKSRPTAYPTEKIEAGEELVVYSYKFEGE